MAFTLPVACCSTGSRREVQRRKCRSRGHRERWLSALVLGGAAAASGVGSEVFSVLSSAAPDASLGNKALAGGTLSDVHDVRHRRSWSSTSAAAAAGPLAAVAAAATAGKPDALDGSSRTRSLGALGIGVVAGGVGGALGLGGGFLVVPALNSLLGVQTRLSIGTSAAVVLAVSCASCPAYISHGLVSFRAAAAIAASALLTARVGAQLTGKTNPKLLKRLFGGWLAIVSFLIGAKVLGLIKVGATFAGAGQTAALLPLLCLGSATGFVSGLLGVGGGTVLVPMLSLVFGFPQAEAQGCALLGMVAPAVVSTFTHYQAENIDRSLVWFAVSGALLGGSAGSKVAALLPEQSLRIVFAVVLAAVAVKCAVTVRYGQPLLVLVLFGKLAQKLAQRRHPTKPRPRSASEPPGAKEDASPQRSPEEPPGAEEDSPPQRCSHCWAQMREVLRPQVSTAYTADAPPGVTCAAGHGGAKQYSMSEVTAVSWLSVAVTLLALLALATASPVFWFLAFLVGMLAVAFMMACDPELCLAASLRAARTGVWPWDAEDTAEFFSKRVLPSAFPPARCSQPVAAVARATVELPPEAASAAWRAATAWASAPRAAASRHRSLARRGPAWVLLEAKPSALVAAPLEAFLLVPRGSHCRKGLTVHAFT
ncbi:unnamed protein product, partial [Polarella glacialis]